MGEFLSFMAGMAFVPVLRMIVSWILYRKGQRLDIHTRQRRQQMSQGEDVNDTASHQS